jgi:5-(carboxyamino)imidazole ribonucleotide synthase
MPLGSTELIQPAAMLNLLGAEGVNGKYELTGLDQLLSTEGIYIHLYNKETSKPHRKMGHITVLGATIEEVKEKATFVQNNIGMKAL